MNKDGFLYGLFKGAEFAVVVCFCLIMIDFLIGG